MIVSLGQDNKAILNSPHYSLCIPKVCLLLQALRTRTMFHAFFTYRSYRHCQLTSASSSSMWQARGSPQAGILPHDYTQYI